MADSGVLVLDPVAVTNAVTPADWLLEAMEADREAGRTFGFKAAPRRALLSPPDGLD